MIQGGQRLEGDQAVEPLLWLNRECGLKPGAIFCVEISAAQQNFTGRLVGLVTSSGTDRETIVPDRTSVRRYPSACSCSKALNTGRREISNSAARARVDGTRCTGLNSPLTIASRNQS